MNSVRSVWRAPIQRKAGAPNNVCRSTAFRIPSAYGDDPNSMPLAMTFAVPGLLHRALILLPVSCPGIARCREEVSDGDGVVPMSHSEELIFPRRVHEQGSVTPARRCRRHHPFTHAFTRTEFAAPVAFDGRDAEHGLARLDERRTKGGMLHPLNRPVERQQILHRLLDLHPRGVAVHRQGALDTKVRLHEVCPVSEGDTVLIGPSSIFFHSEIGASP